MPRSVRIWSARLHGQKTVWSVKNVTAYAGIPEVEVSGVEIVNGQKAFVLRFLQCRDPSWIGRVFFAKRLSCLNQTEMVGISFPKLLN